MLLSKTACHSRIKPVMHTFCSCSMFLETPDIYRDRLRRFLDISFHFSNKSVVDFQDLNPCLMPVRLSPASRLHFPSKFVGFPNHLCSSPNLTLIATRQPCHPDHHFHGLRHYHHSDRDSRPSHPRGLSSSHHKSHLLANTPHPSPVD